MNGSSHITNKSASAFVRTYPADTLIIRSYNQNMARRGIPKEPISWFLPEWMASCGLSGRGAQTRMMELTGWSKATMSQLFNGTQDFSPKILREAARALNARTYELLMHPDEAMALRRLRESAIQIAADTPGEDKVDHPPFVVLEGSRTGTDG